MIGRKIVPCLLLVVAACQCGEAEPKPKPHPLDPGTAVGVSPSLSLASRCSDLISEADVQKVCGVAVTTRAGSDEWDCERLFEPETGAARLTISVVNELTAEQAEGRFDRLADEVKGRSGFATVDGVGERAHSFNQTYGAGEGYRRMLVLDVGQSTYVARLRAAAHPDSKPVCKTNQLREVAKLLLDRLQAEGNKAAP